jgi:hydrogenase nickel incorporation protein HypB
MPLRVVEIHQSILRKNATLARELRDRFARDGTYVFNFLSSPGAGKTTLLEETLQRFGDRYRIAALVGDQATDNDAERLRRSGVPVKQIVTGAECRLDASMVGAGLRELDVAGLEVLAIENVGNLICPAEYDLGEDLRVVVFSTTEGEDKPLKYPLAFATAHLVAISKIDLAAAARFDREAARANIERVHPGMEIVELSALTGEGIDEWIECLDRQIASKRVLV